MKKVLKQVVGIDIAQKELVATVGRMYNDLTIELFAHDVFKNNKKGIISLVKWVKSLVSSKIGFQFVMEATGVYHQNFAYYLEEKGYDLSIVLPNKISNYMRTLDIKTITDKTASQAITRFGLERKLDSWKRPRKCYKQLQQLTRERDQIVDERAIVKNQIHAENVEAEANKRSLKRMKSRIKFLNSQEKEIKEDIAKIVNADPDLKKDVDNLCTIPGVSILTATIVLGETNGFELIRNKKQLTSYAGLDVKEKLSGTSVKGKPRISKKGNRHLRKSMHFPSLSSVKYNKNHKELYARLVAKSGIKMKALMAIQRKLLELMYVIYKNNTPFNEDYEQEKRANSLQLADAL